MSKRPFHKRLGRAFRLAYRELLGKRNAYEGASINRLLMDFVARAVSADEEIRGDIRRLRARARQLSRDNSYVKRYLRMLATNVIGPKGITLQAQTPDAAINTAIETAWADWASNPITIDGRLNLRRLENLALKTVACDGEALIRLYPGYEGNRYGLALQTLDADLLDEQYNRPAQGNENEIRMGVEIDSVGRPVGYWLWKMNAITGITAFKERYFVPADRMLHLYDPDRVNQTRGVTWIHSVMVPAHMLHGYEESEAIAARAAAAKMGFFQKRQDAIAGGLGNEKTPATMDAAPGVIEIAPDGYEFAPWSPDHPTSQFPAFVKQLLRKIASGLSVFYNALANDAENITYSTMRSFALIERDDWRAIQQDWIDMFRRPLYQVWLLQALTTGALLLYRDPARYQAVRHRPRGWQWIDPEKETKAAVLAVKNLLASRTGFLAEKGEVFEDVCIELENEKKLAEKHGLTIEDVDAALMSDSNSAPPNEDA